MKYFMPAFFCLLFCFSGYGQDSSIIVGSKIITLSNVVVNNKLNVPAFIDRIKNDTSFYKAFRNLHILGFTAINDIRMNDADGKIPYLFPSPNLDEPSLRAVNATIYLSL